MLPGFRPEAQLPTHARPAPGLLHDQSTRTSDVTPSRRGERGEPRGTSGNPCLSAYPAGVRSGFAGHFGEGLRLRDVYV